MSLSKYSMYKGDNTDNMDNNAKKVFTAMYSIRLCNYLITVEIV